MHLRHRLFSRIFTGAIRSSKQRINFFTRTWDLKPLKRIHHIELNNKISLKKNRTLTTVLTDKDIVPVKSHTFSNESRTLLIPVHAPSLGAMIDNIMKYLNLAKIGSIIGGDFNVNFLTVAGQTALTEALKKKKFKIKISEASLAKFKVWYKKRDESELFSAQIMKNGVPDVFWKDLAFEVEELQEGEDPIPAMLRNKLNELTAIREAFLYEFNLLNKDDANYEASINALIIKYDMVTFHNYKQSHFDDHASVYIITKDAKGNVYKVYFKNSLEHFVIDMKAHFKDHVMSEYTIPQLKVLYRNLGKKVLLEAAKLLAKRDCIEINNFDEKNYDYLKAFVAERLAESKSSSNKVNLEAKDFRDFFEKVLFSDEEKAINKLLRHSYPLENEDFKEQKLNTLVSDKYMEVYKTSIGKILNVPFQALDISIPKEHEQSISLKNNGFPPFINEFNELIPIECILETQIQNIINELTELHKLPPIGEIEGYLIEGNGQVKKCQAIDDHVEQLNKEVEAELENEAKANATSHSIFSHPADTALSDPELFTAFGPKV